MNATIQIIEKNGHEEYAVVPIEEWHRICALAEDAEDIAAADHAVRELAAGYDEVVPAEVVRKLLEDKHPLYVWRQYRGLTQQALADAADIGKSYISQIESGAKAGSVKCLARLAAVLGVDVDDLIADNNA
ncbi:MAG: helix-turn-helix transcriptional regulator [Gammaproteobacteria bacterium]|jgi:DNA-binding XRE family transcriptional regulator|nr:helix-turn-helix transcriptional regulator [Gammaproteobacteria bacterium]